MCIQRTAFIIFHSLPWQATEIGSKEFFVAAVFVKRREDYKEEYLMVWENYMSRCKSIAGLYFEGTCDVLSVTMATHKVHKNVH